MIQIIAGVYRRKMPDGSVKAMNKDSEPFEVSPEQEDRLIRLGLAVHVDEVNTDMPIGFDEVPPTDDDGEPELPEGVIGIPEYSTKNTKAELEEIAALCGLTFENSMTKAEMVAALDAHIEANMVAGANFTEDGVEIIEGDTEDDGEPAPTFDASEAVL